MKVLDPLLVQSLGKGDHREVVCIIAKGLQIQSLGENEEYSNVLYVDFSINNLTAVDGFKVLFPTSWWINLGRNALQYLTHEDFPGAIGSLDLSKNILNLEPTLRNLISKHILRLKLSGNDGFDSTETTARKTIITVLSDVWVLDEDFISSTERKKAKDLVSVRTWTASNQKVYMNGNWEKASTIATNERVSILLSAIHKFPDNEMIIDLKKLEILLEDYFEHARIYNKYGMHQDPTRGQAKEAKAISVINITQLLHLPHRLRLDLATVITCSLLYEIPTILMDDALSILLINYLSTDSVHKITHLPPFVKTGLVCILRKISARERQEYQHSHKYCIKPSEKVKLNGTDGLPAPNFEGVEGFNHLRSYREYMALDIENPLKLKYDENAEHEPFSELEHEILDTLPDIPTKNTQPPQGSVGFRDWVSFTARHTILILKKSPTCPPLTRPLTQLNHQQMYDKLLPILQAAGMTYKDLEIDFTGPALDGRNVQKVGGNVNVEGNVLGFGQGLPKEHHNRLIWNYHPVTSQLRTQFNNEMVEPVDDSLIEPSIDLTENSMPSEALHLSDVNEMYESMKNASIPTQLRERSIETSSSWTDGGSDGMTNAYSTSHLPEHSKSQHAPIRQGGYLSIDGPAVYNIVNTLDVKPRNPNENGPSIPKLARGNDLLPGQAMRPSSHADDDDDYDRQREGQIMQPSTSSTDYNDRDSIVKKGGIWISPSSANSTSHMKPYTPNRYTSSATPSPIKGGIKASGISGFSADVAWKPSFLLAPTKIMEAQMKDREIKEVQQGHMPHPDAQRWWKWDDITKAPVVVHPNMASHVTVSMPVEPNDVHQSNENDDQRNKDGYVTSGDLRNEIIGAPSSAGRVNEKTKTLSASDAAHQLLLDMGTIRNARNNYSRSTLNLHIPGENATGNLKLSSFLKKKVGTNDMNSELPSVNAGNKSGSIPLNFSWSTYVATEVLDSTINESGPLPGKSADPPDFFLTSTDINDDEEESLQEKKRNENKEEPQYNDFPTMHTTQMPTSLLLRETLRYPKVYVANSMVEKKDTSITNGHISYSWHPRYEKIVYTLDKDTLNEVSLNEINKDTIPANIIASSTKDLNVKKVIQRKEKKLELSKSLNSLHEVMANKGLRPQQPKIQPMPKTVRDGRGGLLPEPTVADTYCQRSFREPISKSTSLSRLPLIGKSHRFNMRRSYINTDIDNQSMDQSRYSTESNREREQMGRTILQNVGYMDTMEETKTVNTLDKTDYPNHSIQELKQHLPPESMEGDQKQVVERNRFEDSTVVSIPSVTQGENEKQRHAFDDELDIHTSYGSVSIQQPIETNKSMIIPGGQKLEMDSVVGITTNDELGLSISPYDMDSYNCKLSDDFAIGTKVTNGNGREVSNIRLNSPLRSTRSGYDERIHRVSSLSVIKPLTPTRLNPAFKQTIGSKKRQFALPVGQENGATLIE